MAKVVVTNSQDWMKVASLAGGDPKQIMFDPVASELEVPVVTQTALDDALTDYVANQATYDAATAAATVAKNRTTAASRADVDIATRELVDVLLFEVNKANTRLQELQDALTAVKGTTGGSDNIRAGIPASFLTVNPKTRGAVLQKYVDDINAGMADA